MSQTAQLLNDTNWKEVLAAERNSEYFTGLLQFVENERRQGKTVYPANKDIFNALAWTEFAAVKVVILGQDPYHGPNQAHGLCFSVKPPTPAPPSLQNIFKELNADLGFTIPNHGCLENWAHAGVLLLNTVLTVEQGKPQSHVGRGWERFTDSVIKSLNDYRSGLVFLLWGAPAQKKVAMIDPSRHTVLTAPHPSPLSAHRGFLGCRHFSKTNQILEAYGVAPIDWRL